jgi:hypothetical protein
MTGAFAIVGSVSRDVRIMSDVWEWRTYPLLLTVNGVKEGYLAEGEAALALPTTLAVEAAKGLWTVAEAALTSARSSKTWLAEKLKDLASAEVKGRTVKVTKARAKGKGTEGVVRWIGQDRFSNRARLGLALESGEMFFTNASNVTVTGGVTEEETEVALLAEIEAEAAAEEAFGAVSVAKAATVAALAEAEEVKLATMRAAVAEEFESVVTAVAAVEVFENVGGPVNQAWQNN